LFNNVFILDSDRRLLDKLPPVPYWLGPVACYRHDAGSDAHRYWANRMCFVFVVGLPITIAFLASSACMAWWGQIRHGRCQALADTAESR
jgi:hypothetical protein